jgi:hypothetical protein
MNAGELSDVSSTSHYCRPAAELDSAAATLAVPIVETVSDDDSVLTGDATCTTSVDTASMITHRPIFVWGIRVVKSVLCAVRYPLCAPIGGSRYVYIRHQQHRRYRSSRDVYDQGHLYC